MNDTTQPGAGLLQVAAPHRELLDELLDKWSLQVLDQLCERPSRFNELRRAIPAVGQKSLTATLRRLERNGMIERVVLEARPIAVEYRIAPVGNTPFGKAASTGPRSKLPPSPGFGGRNPSQRRISCLSLPIISSFAAIMTVT